MPRGSIARRTVDGSNAAAAAELIADAGMPCKVLQVQVTLAAATASTYGLGRPAAKGITPTSPVQLLSEQNADALKLPKTALQWGTGPTAPANFFRRVSFPATISSNIIWDFVDGLFVPAGGSLVLWNLAANGVVDVTFVVKL